MGRRHNHNYNEKLLFKAIKELILYCFDGEEFSFKIMSESDLKCFLYSVLINLNVSMRESKIKLTQYILSNNEIIEERTSKKKIRCPIVITEAPYSKVYKSGIKTEDHSHYCDLAIIDKDEIEFYYTYRPILKINEIKEYYLNKYLENSVFIELKWQWGRQVSSIIPKIKEDLNKLP